MQRESVTVLRLSKGTAIFLCAHWLPWDNSSKVELSSHTQKRPAVPQKWLFLPCELGRISQNTGKQGAQTQQCTKLKHHFPVKPGVSPRNKIPSKVLLSANWNLPHSGRSLLQTSDRDAEASPKLNPVGYLLPEHTRAAQSTKLTLQPHHFSSISDCTHGCFSGQRPGLPRVYYGAGPLRRGFPKA